MSKYRLAAAVAACLIASAVPAAAADAGAGVPTIVLAEKNLSTVHLLTALPPEEQYQSVPQNVQPGYGGVPSTGSIGGDAAAVAIASLIINMQADEIAQTNADQELAVLNDGLGLEGTQAVLRRAFDDGFAAAGLDQRALLFTPTGSIGPKLFQRIAGAKDAGRYVIVRDGDGGKGVFPMPVALDYTHRQLRVAFDVEVLGGRLDRPRQAHRRDVVWFTDPLPVEEGVAPLDTLAADDQARYRALLSQAVIDAVQLAMSERELPEVDRDAEVGAIGELGLNEFPGVLLAHADGRATILTHGDTLVSVPATRIVTGDELVAARTEEAARRDAFVAALRVPGEELTTSGSASTAKDAKSDTGAPAAGDGAR